MSNADSPIYDETSTLSLYHRMNRIRFFSFNYDDKIWYTNDSTLMRVSRRTVGQGSGWKY